MYIQGHREIQSAGVCSICELCPFPPRSLHGTAGKLEAIVLIEVMVALGLDSHLQDEEQTDAREWHLRRGYPHHPCRRYRHRRNHLDAQ